jgi:phage tail P2-like protein
MFDLQDTLLPPTATPLAKALDILEERLFGLPVDVITKDPATVEAGLLDHLAWENSVDVWDPDWPEDVRRAMIARSDELHQTKGTPYAVRLALELCGASAELEEWWEDGVNGVPGTFQVTAYVTRNLYEDARFLADPNTHRLLIQVVGRVSPVSRGFSFLLGVRGTGDLAVSAGVRQRTRQTADMVPRMKAMGRRRSAGVSAVRVRSRRAAVFQPVLNILGNQLSSASAAVRVSSRVAEKG